MATVDHGSLETEFALLRHIMAVLLGFAVMVGAAEPEATDALRVRWIRPATFDYTLVSVFTGGNDRTILGFNHRSGRSHFVGVGEALGPHKVALFLPATERVFNATINAYEAKKGGTAVLRDAEGNRTRLRLGMPLEEEGWAARVLSLDSGKEWTLKQGDTVRTDEVTFRVAGIGEGELRVTPESGANRVVAFATKEETGELRERLAWRREAQRKKAAEAGEREARRKMLKALANEPLMTRSARQKRDSVGESSSSRLAGRTPTGATFSFGTEYRYPVEYEVVPRWIYHAGRHVYSPIVVPTRFETRHHGMRIHGAGVNVLPAPY